MKYLPILLVLAAGRSFASDVSGAVTLRSGRPAGFAVVSLKGSVHSTPLANAVVDQRDKTFLPHVSVVTVGTEVQFPNHDTVFHNVFTEYHSTKFDLGMYARGRSKSQKFDVPGLAVLMCSVHPAMSAYVMVVDTPFYAIADSKGRFHIKDVKPGKYRVQVWQENGEKLEQDLTVEDNVSVQFTTHR